MGAILPLFKGGNRADVGDYRPITLTSCVGKLFERLLLDRLSKLCDALLVEEQGGFRAGRSTLDQIFTLHEIMAHRKEHGQATYMAFLDCRRAYDRVWVDGLLLRLLDAGVTGQMFKVLRSMLTTSKRRVVVGGESSDSFETTVGLPQGAVLSPLLYALFINGLAVELKQEGFGVDVFGRRVGILLYADDIVLIAESPEQLQEMLSWTSRYANEWQFRFNTKPGKSDVVVCGSKSQCEAPLPEFRMGDGVLRVSTYYKYLGVEMGKVGRGGWLSFLTRIDRKANVAMQQLVYSVSGRSPLQLRTAVHLFNTLVRSRMEYANSIWGAMCSASALRKLERVQTQFGRRLLRLTDHIAGEYVRQELGMESVAERVAAATMRFWCRLSAMPESRLAGFIFRKRCEEVDNNRRRAKHSWCVAAKTMLQQMGWDQEWENRSAPDEWRARIKKEVSAHFHQRSQDALKDLSSLDLFARLGPASRPGWLDYSLRHPGAALRLKLRCGGVPLMMSVGARAKLPREQRTCRICATGDLETPEHFVSTCPVYANERADCLTTIGAHLARQMTPRLRQAVDNADPELFLGDGLLRGLPEESAKAISSATCNFLMVAWRKREPLWTRFCEPNSKWRLRPS